MQYKIINEIPLLSDPNITTSCLGIAGVNIIHELEETIIQLEVLKDMRQTIPETNQVEERP